MASNGGTERRGYRYLVDEVSESMADRVHVGEHVVDWTYFGRGHTWTIYDTKTWELTGWWHGVYVDKGVMRDHKFVSDKEAA